MGEKIISGSKFDILDAMEEICLKYKFKLEDISVFLPIYYPVAMIKMSMLEHILEDIDQIPLTILKLVSLGVSEAEEISKMTGLSEEYVSSMINIMTGTRQIEEGKLTKYGVDSIKEKKNIQLKSVEQCFQIDTLTGDIIKQKQIIKETELFGCEETTEQMIHVLGLPGIDEDKIKKQLLSESNNYLDNNNESIHSNVEKIESIEYVELKYAKAYLVKLNDFPAEPLIFSMRMDKTHNSNENIFSFQPYFVWTKEQSDFLNIDEGIRQIDFDLEIQNSIFNLLDLVNSRLDSFKKSDNYRKKLYNIITNLFPIDGFKIIEDPQKYYLCEVLLEAEMIKRCNSSLLHLLWLMSNYGAAYVVNEQTGGRLVKLSSSDEEINKLLHGYINACEKKGRKSVKTEILNKFAAYNGENLANDMILFFSKY